MYDLVLKQARVIDPQAGLDEVCDIAFKDGSVAIIQEFIPASEALESYDLTGRLVVPGLIDLHTHVYWGGAAIGIEPDAYARSESTRLNSSHKPISYAVFCLKKKKY